MLAFEMETKVHFIFDNKKEIGINCQFNFQESRNYYLFDC